MPMIRSSRGSSGSASSVSSRWSRWPGSSSACSRYVVNASLWVPGALDQRLDQVRRRRVTLHQRDVAEERDRVVVIDPVVLAPDERSDARRRHPVEDRLPRQSDQLKVAEQRLVVAELFVDVLLQVRRERLVAQFPRADERGLRQRHRRPDDLVLEDEVLGPELPEARVLDERVVGDGKRGDEQAELPPQAGARGVELGQ
jgi:hypothetical protein